MPKVKYNGLEKWKKIDGVNFMISNRGRVKCITTGEIKKPSKAKNGYLVFTAWNPDLEKKVLLYVHKLVAAYFLPIDQYNECVNHIDGNKENNCVENLEWCTLAENTKHAYRTGLIKNYRGIEIIENGMKFEKIIDCISWLRNNGYPKARHSNVISVIQGKRHIAYGYTYRYLEG